MIAFFQRIFNRFLKPTVESATSKVNKTIADLEAARAYQADLAAAQAKAADLASKAADVARAEVAKAEQAAAKLKAFLTS